MCIQALTTIYLMVQILVILTQFDAFVKHLQALPRIPHEYILQIDEVFAHDDDLVAESAEKIGYSLACIVVGRIQPNRPEEMNHFWQTLSDARGVGAGLQLFASVSQDAQELDIRFRLHYPVLDLVLQY